MVYPGEICTSSTWSCWHFSVYVLRQHGQRSTRTPLKGYGSQAIHTPPCTASDWKPLISKVRGWHRHYSRKARNVKRGECCFVTSSLIPVTWQVALLANELLLDSSTYIIFTNMIYRASYIRPIFWVILGTKSLGVPTMVSTLYCGMCIIDMYHTQLREYEPTSWLDAY